MAKITRRNCLQGTLAAAMAGAGATPVLAGPGGPQRKTLRSRQSIRLAQILGPGDSSQRRLMRQIGVNHVILGAAAALNKVPKERYEETLAGIKADFESVGMTIDGVESHPVAAEKIKLGLPGRDEELENYVVAIRALGNVGIPVVCYNFMAGLGWYRTKVNVPERGGALTSEFDNKAAIAQGLTQWGEVPEEKIWDNMIYFQKALIPVAEKAGIQMALHPDDPPLSPLRGIGRILTSAASFRRVMNIVPSPINGVTFCQANFVAMGEDIEALAREWGAQKKIFFVHYRDIAGQGEYFRETFHDNGPTDMVRMMKVYHETGFAGPMRPDHAPTLEGEANDRPGYAVMGKVLAFGYMRGILEGMNIPYA